MIHQITKDEKTTFQIIPKYNKQNILTVYSIIVIIYSLDNNYTLIHIT